LTWLSARVHSSRKLAGWILGAAPAARHGRIIALHYGVAPSRLCYMLDGCADTLLIGCALGVLHGADAMPTR
jgi:hypothetical protein